MGYQTVVITGFDSQLSVGLFLISKLEIDSDDLSGLKPADKMEQVYF